MVLTMLKEDTLFYGKAVVSELEKALAEHPLDPPGFEGAIELWRKLQRSRAVLEECERLVAARAAAGSQPLTLREMCASR